MYEQLPTAGSIRALSFKPLSTYAAGAPANARADAVHCEWSVITVTDPERYDALSYVWGDMNVREHDLVCNGVVIKITRNLWTALRAVWAKSPGRRLWVDAICINQDDIPERNQQVNMMGDIYRRAERVIVWLGEATELTNGLCRVMEVVEAGGKLSRAALDGPEVPRLTGNPNTDVRNLAHYLSDCGDEIARRTWSRRAWTLQEIMLASHAVVQWGDNAVDNRVLQKTVWEINCMQTALDICGARMVCLPTFYDVSVRNYQSFYRTLATTQARQATDPRDKVFSIMSLLPKGLYEFMRADYALSVEETFTWVSRICIEIDNEMNVLVDAGLAVKRSGNLPSWVTDWSASHSQIYQWVNLSRSLTGAAKDHDARRLRRERGAKLDKTGRTIGICSSAFGRLQLDDEGSSLLLEVFPWCATKGFYVQGREDEGLPQIAKLSDGDFLSFCKAIKVHDDTHCKCIHGAHRLEYSVGSIPDGMTGGDWLWTTGVNGMSERDGGDEITHFHYALRQVDKSREPLFQLVRKLKGMSGLWASGSGADARLAVRAEGTFMLV